MPALRGPEFAILFVGAIYSSAEVFTAASAELRESFGDILLESPALPWNYTDYYENELTPPCYRSFVFFEADIDASYVVDAKLTAMKIEDRFSRGGARQINIDPGYMTLAKVVLVSRKNYSHRIYLGRGVFGEAELFYKDGIFNAFPYTYPDYRDTTFLDFFYAARSLLKKKGRRVTHTAR